MKLSVQSIVVATLVVAAGLAVAQVPKAPAPNTGSKTASTPPPITKPTVWSPQAPSDVAPLGPILAKWAQTDDTVAEPAGVEGVIRLFDEKTQVFHIVSSYFAEDYSPIAVQTNGADLKLLFRNRQTNATTLIYCSGTGEAACHIHLQGGTFLNTPPYSRLDVRAPLPTGIQYAITFRHDTTYTGVPAFVTAGTTALKYNPTTWRFESIALAGVSGSTTCNPTGACINATWTDTGWTARAHH